MAQKKHPAGAPTRARKTVGQGTTSPEPQKAAPAPPGARRGRRPVKQDQNIAGAGIEWPDDEGPLCSEFSPDSGDQQMRDEISPIVHGMLYLTNFRGVENIDGMLRLGIKYVVCVNEQTNSHPDHFVYFNIDTLEDQEDHDATPHFEKVNEFTDKALRAKDGAVVFHCAAGISRSTTMLIAYIMGKLREKN